MRNWARSLLLIGVLATPAVATPPQVIWVEDTLFAIGDDSVMILRDIKDNQGMHSVTQTDTFLLTLSLQDGSVVSVDPVQRAIDTDLGEPEWDKTTFPELGDAAVNPYHERAQVGLAPLSDPVRGRRFAMIHPSGILMSQGDEITHLLPLADAQLQMERALTQTRAVLPVLHSDAGAEDLFDPTGYTIGLGCSVNNVMTFWQADGASPALVNLFCELSEEAGSLDVWIVVPPVQT